MDPSIPFASPARAARPASALSFERATQPPSKVSSDGGGGAGPSAALAEKESFFGCFRCVAGYVPWVALSGVAIMLAGVLVYAVAAVGAAAHARRVTALIAAAPGGVTSLAVAAPAAVTAVVLTAAAASVVGAVADAARADAAARGDGAVAGGPVRPRAYRCQRTACIALAALSAVYCVGAVGLGVAYFWASYIFTNTARSAYNAASGTAATLDVAGEMLEGMDRLMRAVKDPAAAANPALAALNSTLTSLYNSVTPALKSAVAAGVESVARRMDDDGAAVPLTAAPLRDEAVFMTASSGAKLRVCISNWCADLAAVPGARSAACVCRPAALAAVRFAAERAATGSAWAGGGLLLVAGGSALLFGHFAATAAAVAAERDALYGRGTRVDRLVDAKARRRARAAAAAAGLSPRSPRWPLAGGRPSLARTASGESGTPTGAASARPASAFTGQPPPLPPPPPPRRAASGV